MAASLATHRLPWRNSNKNKLPVKRETLVEGESESG